MNNEIKYRIEVLLKEANYLTAKDFIENIKWEDFHIGKVKYPNSKEYYYNFNVVIPQYNLRGKSDKKYFRQFLHGGNMGVVDLNDSEYREKMVSKMKVFCYKRLIK
jgi:hypothetical protein